MKESAFCDKLAEKADLPSVNESRLISRLELVDKYELHSYDSSKLSLSFQTSPKPACLM